MKHRRFKDISIVSTKKPFNTHLWWEHSTYGLILVDADDQTKLFISTDKGDNWAEIDLSDNTNSYKIQSGWLEGNDLWLVMCDNDGTADDFEVCFIELDDSNDCNPIGVSVGAAANSVYAYDIWIYGGNTYVVANEERVAEDFVVVWDVDTAPFVEKDDWAAIGGSGYYGVLIGDKFFFIVGNPATLFEYDDGDVTITLLELLGNFYNVPTSRNLWGMAYDGSDLLYFVLTKIVDGKNYLISYSIGGDSYTELSEYNIALMLDRNNSGIAPNELEKGFSIDSTEIVYEIKPRKAGVRILQDMSAITDAVIIAITDNFLMNDDGDMFEFQDVTSEISNINYNDGIMGILKRGIFTVHPDFHINWSKGDSIKIYDDNDVLEFYGLINDKNRNARGIYIYKIDSFTNEIFRKTYENAYSGDDTDTKQKDIIDNACDFCYRSSSIVGTTTNYDYVYNKAVIYLFWLTRFLERQVPYIEPDGKIWTKAHDGLVRNDMIYPGTYSFKEEEDGTSGTDIDLIQTDNSAANCGVEIISNVGGHRKVLEIDDQNGAGRVQVFFDNISQTSGTVEFWIRTTDVTKETFLGFWSGAANAIRLLIDASKIQYSDGGVYQDAIDPAVNNTWYHIRIDFDVATDTFDIYVDGVSIDTGVDFDNNVGIIAFLYLQTLAGDTGYTSYMDAIGYSWDPAYTVGDNEVAWDINNHWQEVFLIDIPGLEEKIQGFFDGNSGITRNTIRYKNNATTIRPVAATRDPIEQLQGVLPLNEFRDPKIEAATEANQLGDNRYDIWSSDIIFLGLRIEGQGYLQPGKTIEIENTGQITISKDDFLILSFERDPKNDIYTRMILSDNIIFPNEFSSLQNTTGIQVHTASVQALENQANLAVFIPRRLSQSAEPTPAVGELIIWHDTDDSKTYLVYNDTDEGVRIVELI